MEKLGCLDELKGLKILKAVKVDVGQKMVLLFDNNTYCALSVEFWGDSYEITPERTINDYLMLEAGVITQDEYKKRKAHTRLEAEHKTRMHELKELERLKAKYEG